MSYTTEEQQEIQSAYDWIFWMGCFAELIFGEPESVQASQFLQAHRNESVEVKVGYGEAPTKITYQELFELISSRGSSRGISIINNS